jgi:hypothetical protein
MNIQYCKRILLVAILISYSLIQTFAQAPTVTTPNVTAITNNSATLGGNITSGAGITARGTRWSTTTPVGTTNSVDEGLTASGPFTHNRVSITPGSKIYYVAFATNASGTGTTVDDGSVFFYTLSNEPTNQPASFTAATASDVSIDLTFSPANTITNASGYIILYRTDGANPTITGIVDGTAPGSLTLPGGTSLAATITDITSSASQHIGLNPDDPYNYLIIPYSFDGSNNATYNYKTDGILMTAASVTLATEPLNNPTAFAASIQAPTTIRLTWTGATGSPTPTDYLIVARKTGGTFATVTDGSLVSNDNDFSDGNTNGAINRTHAGGGNTYDWTGLDPASSYEFEIYPYRAGAANNRINYKTTSTLSASAATPATEPTNHATAFSVSARTSSSITLDWTGATGANLPSNYLIIARKNTGGSFPGVADGTPVTDDFDFTGGGLNGAVNVIHAVGANTYTWTGLDPETRYNFEIYSYSGTGAGINFKTGGAPTANAYTFALEPATHPSYFDAVATSSTNIRLSFPAASTITNADGYILLRRTDGTDPDGTGVDDGTQPGSLTLTPGTTRITTITSMATTFYDDNVTAGNQYNYAIIAYNYDGSNNVTYNYLTTPTILTSNDFTSAGVTVTQGSAASCPNNFVTLSNIVIKENGKGDFNAGGTFFLEFSDPSFSFQPGQGAVSINPGPAGSNTTDISSIGIVVNASRVTLNYTLDGTNNKLDEITISGLRVNYDGSPPTSTTIVRAGGTADQKGNNSNATHATATSLTLSGTPVLSITTLNYCQNDVISPMTVVNAPNNLNVRWFRDAALSNEILAIAGVTNPTAAQLEFNTAVSGTVVRYVTQTPGGQCQSTPASVTLNVQPKPVADLVITSGSNSLCTNFLNGNPSYQPVQFTASPSGASNYNFRVNGITTQTGASNILNRNSNDFTTGDQVTVIITVAGSCPSTSNSISMTKNSGTSAVSFVLTSPPPNTPNTASTFSDKEPPIALSGTPPGGIFSGTGIVGNTFNPSGVPIGTYPITYTATTAGCTGSSTRNFEVYDGSTAIIGLEEFYCSTSPNFVMDVANNSIPGTTFLYILPLNYYFSPLLPPLSVRSGNLQEVTATNEVNWFQGFLFTSGPFYISPSIIASTGTKTVQFYAVYRDNVLGTIITRTQDVTFYVTPPAPPVTLASGYCLGGPTILTNVVNVTTLTGATVNWYTNAGLTSELTSIAGDVSPTLLELAVSDAGPATFTRYVTQTINGCTSSARTVVINVFNKPAAPVAPSPPAVCSGTSFNNVLVTGTNINWYTTFPTNPVTPVNPANVTATELGVPNINLTTNPVSVTRFVTQTINGCQSDPTSVVFTINPIPAAPIAPSPSPYCISQPIADLNAIGTNLRWYDEDKTTFLPTVNPAQPTAAELQMTSTNPAKFLRYVSQTTAGCEGPLKDVEVLVQDLPSVSIFVTGGGDLNALCQSGTLVNLRGAPAGGSWSGSASGALINTDIGAGTTQLNPASLTAGSNYVLRYDFTSQCANFVQENVLVLPSVQPSLSIVDNTACNGFFVGLENTSTIIPANATSTIVGYAWSFGDQTGILDYGSGAIADGSQGGTSKGSYQIPQHLFPAQGQFLVEYRIKTSDGCEVTSSAPVQIRPVPVIDFSWDNVCFGSGTVFTANVTNGVSIPAGNYDWNFAKNGNLSISTAGSGGTATTTYGNTGKDIVELIVTSAFNCRDTIQKPVYIVPVATPLSPTQNYTQPFDVDNGQWIDGGANSSWQYGLPDPTNQRIKSDASGSGNAWVTNLTGQYNANEQSWVMSPCLNFSGTSKPVISLDIFSDTPLRSDGAVVQYNTSANVENNANWITLGNVNLGVNWYNSTGISSNPGSQPSGSIGWSGDQRDGFDGWKKATYQLDNLIGQSNVKFRVAFGSRDGARQEGFGIDNVFIGERSRTVLIENFTNSSAGITARNQNNYFNSLTSTEIAQIQYHTSIPGEDPINSISPTLYDSRAAFYGITSVPAARLDGGYKNGLFVNWGPGVYDAQVLSPSSLEIDLGTTKLTDGTVEVTVTLRNTTQDIIPAGTYIFTVVVDLSVTDPELLGASGNNEFKYIAREMLPSPAGFRLPKAIPANGSYTVPSGTLLWKEQKLFTSNNGAIIVFVQNDNNSKQVLQAKVYNNPLYPDIITGIESSNFGEHIVLYPNPASNSFVIELPTKTDTRLSVHMIDQVGRVVHESSIETGEQSKTINTQDLAGGIYIVQIGAGKSGVVRKKMMIVHKN